MPNISDFPKYLFSRKMRVFVAELPIYPLVCVLIIVMYGLTGRLGNTPTQWILEGVQIIGFITAVGFIDFLLTSRKK